MRLDQRLNPPSFSERMPYLKLLFWVYFLLLVFEGALRKWIVPGLSAPLLLIRDPIAVLIIVEAMLGNKWPERWSTITGMLTAGLISLCLLQMLAVDNPWIAAVYGLRSYLLPFPVAFIMGENLDEEDLRKFGVCILWILLPMTLLEVAQYLAPAASFLNAGAYKGGGQIGYAAGHARASGTFSYVVGPVNFNTLAAAFVFYGLITEGFAEKWLLWAAGGALLLSVPVIGARTLVYTLGATVVCVGIAALSGVSQFGKALRIAIPALIISLLVSLLPVFSQASTTLRVRFTQARGSQGSEQSEFQSRTVGFILDKIEQTDLLSNPIGIGMGQGAAAVTQLLHGKSEFTAGETEFDRAINEFGPLPGLAFMLFCLLLTVKLLTSALQLVRTDGQPLALLLAPALITTLFFGILEQPMETGFMVMTVAFCLGALKRRALPPRMVPIGARPSKPLSYSQQLR